MKIEIHSVILPPRLKVFRDIKEDVRTIDKKPLDDVDLKQYDRDTVFYDVFFDPGNKKIYALGPPMLNFFVDLSPFTLKVNGESIDFEILEVLDRTMTILTSKNLREANVKDKNLVSIEFGDKWKWESHIPRNTFQHDSKLSLNAMQKNNKIPWIKDWIEYYKKAHGVQKIFLYDNGSDYQESLDFELNDADVFIIPWNFLYGPVSSNPNKFCHLASFNHCKLKFGNDGCCLVFDIDELLVVDSLTKNVLDFMQHHDVACFIPYRVPVVRPLPDEYSYGFFQERREENQISRRRKAGKSTDLMYKSVYRFSKVAFVKHHIPELQVHLTLRKRLGRKLLKLVKRLQVLVGVNLITTSRREQLDSFDNVCEYLVRKLESSVNGMNIVPTSEAYFLEYMGITTNWKGSYWNRLSVDEDLNNLVKEISAFHFFTKN